MLKTTLWLLLIAALAAAFIADLRRAQRKGPRQ